MGHMSLYEIASFSLLIYSLPSLTLSNPEDRSLSIPLSSILRRGESAKNSWSIIGICKLTHAPAVERREVHNGYNSKEAPKEEIAI